MHGVAPGRQACERFWKESVMPGKGAGFPELAGGGLRHAKAGAQCLGVFFKAVCGMEEVDLESEWIRRHHLGEETYARAIRRAVDDAMIDKNATSHRSSAMARPFTKAGLTGARRLELVSTKPFRNGAATMHYRRARLTRRDPATPISRRVYMLFRNSKFNPVIDARSH